MVLNLTHFIPEGTRFLTPFKFSPNEGNLPRILYILFYVNMCPQLNVAQIKNLINKMIPELAVMLLRIL